MVIIVVIVIVVVVVVVIIRINPCWHLSNWIRIHPCWNFYGFQGEKDFDFNFTKPHKINIPVLPEVSSSFKTALDNHVVGLEPLD